MTFQYNQRQNKSSNQAKDNIVYKNKAQAINPIDLTTRIQILRKQDIQYETLLCVLLKGLVEESFIIKQIKNRYKTQIYVLNRKWRVLRCNESIIEDVLYINTKNINQNYRNLGIEATKSLNKQKAYDRYLQDIKSPEQLYWRKRKLQSQISALSRKIVSVREANENLQYRKQYNEKTKELSFLRDYRRKKRQLSKQKQIINQLKQNNGIVQQLIQKLQCKQRQVKEKKKIEIVELFDIISQLKHNKNYEKYHTESLFNQLQKIFYFYTKKIHKIQQFSQLDYDFNMLRYHSFSQFIRDCEFNLIFKRQQILKMFNINSKFKKSLRIHQFYGLIKDLCVQYCRKLQIQFQSYILCNFIYKILSKWREKHNMAQVYQGKTRQIYGHTGKYKEDIIQLLKQKKELAAKPKISKHLRQKQRYSILDSRMQRSQNRQTKSQNKNKHNSYLNNYNRSISHNKTQREQQQHIVHSLNRNRQKQLSKDQKPFKSILILPMIGNRYKTQPDQNIRDSYLQSLIKVNHDDDIFDEYMNLQKKKQERKSLQYSSLS